VTAIRHLTGALCWGIDPAPEMVAQGGASDVQWLIGRAERLALAPACFDLVFSVDVIHHVEDRIAYTRQACRVLAAGGRLCTVTDSEWIIRHREPLSTYFPESVESELRRYPRISQLRALMAQAGFVEIEEHQVEHRSELTDIQAYRDRAFSVLHLISEGAFRRGIARMERDIELAPLPCVSRYLMLWGTRP